MAARPLWLGPRRGDSVPRKWVGGYKWWGLYLTLYQLEVRLKSH